MIWKTTILLGFALCVLGDGHHATSEQHIKINHKEHHGHHGDLSHIGSKKPEHHEEYAWSYPSYEFSYSVNDPHTHDKKGQHESRHGDEVKGEYWLIEPDGRKRTVTYHADKHSGFHAIVHYSDKHHHIYEHHGHEEEKKDDDEKKNEEEKGHHEEEKKEDEKKEDSSSSEEDSSEEQGGEEERGGEESRGREGGVIRWGYGPKWDHNKHDNYHEDVRRGRDEKHDRDERKKHDDYGNISIIRNLGSYGHRDGKRGRDEGRDDRDREESLLREERRKFDERRGYPKNLTPYYGHASRVHPRFFPNIQRQQRKPATRY